MPLANVLLNASLCDKTNDVGFVAAMDAARSEDHNPAIRMLAYTSDNLGGRDRLLGGEWPIYEVALDGRVYRMLSRYAAKRGGSELIRSVAPGMQVDGELLTAEPTNAPNTPGALLAELIMVTGRSAAHIVANAFDLLAYRSANNWRYPPTLTPDTYSLRKTMWLATDEGIGFSHYDTPKGVMPDKWLMVHYAIQSLPPQDLVDFAESIAARELLGENTVMALRRAVRSLTACLSLHPLGPGRRGVNNFRHITALRPMELYRTFG